MSIDQLLSDIAADTTVESAKDFTTRLIAEFGIPTTEKAYRRMLLLAFSTGAMCGTNTASLLLEAVAKTARGADVAV